MLPTSQTSPVPSQRCLIPINIETLAGSSFELLVSPYEQIQYIKRKIERREGIPVSQQHLVWKSNELEDESCLHDYKIEADDDEYIFRFLSLVTVVVISR